MSFPSRPIGWDAVPRIMISLLFSRNVSCAFSLSGSETPSASIRARYSPLAAAMARFRDAEIPWRRSCLSRRIRGSENPRITSQPASVEASSTMISSRFFQDWFRMEETASESRASALRSAMITLTSGSLPGGRGGEKKRSRLIRQAFPSGHALPALSFQASDSSFSPLS